MAFQNRSPVKADRAGYRTLEYQQIDSPDTLSLENNDLGTGHRCHVRTTVSARSMGSASGFDCRHETFDETIRRTAMKTQRSALPATTLGTCRELVSFHFGAAGTGRKIYVQAALHADEIPAMLTAWHLKQRLAALEAEGRLVSQIVVVPLANPIGLAQQMLGQLVGRFEANSGQNFNRGFKLPDPSRVIEAVRTRLNHDASHNTTLVRRALRHEIQRMSSVTEFDALRMHLLALAADAEVVLDLHCSLEATMHLYTNGSSWPQLEPLARYLGASGALLADDSGGLSFDEVMPLYWHELHREIARSVGPNLPLGPHAAVATIECRGQRDVSQALAAADAEAIIHYLVYLGAVTGTPPPLPPLPHPATPLAGSEQLNAPCSGVIVYRANIGDRLKAGDAVCDIVDPLTDIVTTVRAGVTGVFYMRGAVRFAFAGTPIGRITGDIPFRTGVLVGA